MSYPQAEILQTKRTRRIAVWFDYDPAHVAAVKEIPGRKWNPDDRHWTVPLSLEAGRALRSIFGPELELGPELTDWARDQIRRERNLGKMATMDDAELHNVPAQLAEFLDPQQRANVAFLTERDAIEGSQPGIGKTEIMIATVLEAQITGPVLISAPVATHQTTWERLIRRWIPDAVVLAGETLDERESNIDVAHHLVNTIEGREIRIDAIGPRFWLVVNPQMIAYRKDKDAEPVLFDGKMQQPLVAPYPQLHQIKWGAVIIDEFRKVGLTNRKTQAHKGFSALDAERRWALSGTPMGGNPKNLWGTLNWIDPNEFTSQWAWMDKWLDSEANAFASSGKTHLPRIKPGLEEQFYASLARHMVRRTRSETRKNAAPRRQDLWCRMPKQQARQYKEFSESLDTQLLTHRLEADNVLTEYLRLKQIAVGQIKMLHPVEFDLRYSGKVNQLLDQLERRGITGGKDEDGDEKVVIASQWNSVINDLEQLLNKMGIETLRITGEETGPERTANQNLFQSDAGPRVMLINTLAGGLGIDLDRADSVHILDVTWDPDDQEQVEFRIDRRGRTRPNPMDIYYYWTEGTIDEYIFELLETKQDINANTLDEQRRAFKERQSA